MPGDLTPADISWRARSEAVIQDALRHATVTDSAVTVSEDGRTVKIQYLEVRLPDGRLVALSPAATVLEINDGPGWHNATVQQDFAGDI